ncbi:MAG TPA: DUF3617 family protein [Sphingomicrobium sp.]|nr:DUF3617 family protein [Sphingomicrobium sp.]
MTRFKLTCAAALAIALAACGGEKKEAVVEEAPASLAAGLYEVTAEVTQLASTDKTTPATKLKQGDKQTVRACVAADGEPDAALFGEEGDKCTIKNSYIRNGRLSAQMSCRREGHNGEVMPAMMGSFTKDGFEGEITTLTYFYAEGDYRMTRKVSARRVGDCPAEGAEKAPA